MTGEPTLLFAFAMASIPIVLFLVIVAAFRFIPTVSRTRFAPLLGVVFCVLMLASVGILSAFAIAEEGWNGATMPVIITGLLAMHLAGKARPAALAYAMVTAAAALMVTPGVVPLLHRYARDPASLQDAGALAGALLWTAAFFALAGVTAFNKVKDIRAARIVGAVKNHSLGTGTTA